MKKMKYLALLMVAVLTIGSLVACGGDDEEVATEPVTEEQQEETEAPEETEEEAEEEEDEAEVEDVTLKVWGPQEEQDLLKQMGDSFAEAHPEYNITWDYGVVSEADAATELTKDAAAGGDVFMFASDQTATLVNAGILYPVTYNVEEANAANSEASVQATIVDGMQYAYPFTPNSWFMYYDSSMFTEEEVQNLDTMMEKDLGDGVYNFACDLNNGWYLSAFFFANGGQLFGEDGTDPTTVTFNDENGVAVGEYLIDLANNPRYLDEDEGNTLAAMEEGKLAAWCSGTWNADAVAEALGEGYAATKLPTITIDGEEKQLSNFADFKLVGVNSSTEHPMAAQQLAEWITNEENQKIRFEERSIAPTNLALAEDPAVQENQAVAALSLQTSHSTLQSTIPEMGNYWSPAEAFGTEVLNGTITKDNLQEKLDTFVESIMSSIG